MAGNNHGWLAAAAAGSMALTKRIASILQPPFIGEDANDGRPDRDMDRHGVEQPAMLIGENPQTDPPQKRTESSLRSRQC